MCITEFEMGIEIFHEEEDDTTFTAADVCYTFDRVNFFENHPKLIAAISGDHINFKEIRVRVYQNNDNSSKPILWEMTMSFISYEIERRLKEYRSIVTAVQNVLPHSVIMLEEDHVQCEDLIAEYADAVMNGGPSHVSFDDFRPHIPRIVSALQGEIKGIENLDDIKWATLLDDAHGSTTRVLDRMIRFCDDDSIDMPQISTLESL